MALADELLALPPLPSHMGSGASTAALGASDRLMSVNSAMRNLVEWFASALTTGARPSAPHTALRHRIMDAVLAHPDFEPACRSAKVVKWAIQYKRMDHLERILSDPKTEPGDLNGSLCHAVECEHVEAVKRLLMGPRVEADAGGNQSLITACRRGSLEIVHMLLSSGRPDVDPAADDNEPLFATIPFVTNSRQHFLVITRLLQEPTVNPAARDYLAIRDADHMGRHDIVVAFLSAPQLDFAATGRALIPYSMTLLALIVGHPRFASLPLEHVHRALRWAVWRLNAGLVERLVADTRIDPSADDNALLLEVLESRKPASVGQILDILLRDARVVRVARELGQLRLIPHLSARLKSGSFLSRLNAWRRRRHAVAAYEAADRALRAEAAADHEASHPHASGGSGASTSASAASATGGAGCSE